VFAKVRKELAGPCPVDFTREVAARKTAAAVVEKVRERSLSGAR